MEMKKNDVNTPESLRQAISDLPRVLDCSMMEYLKEPAVLIVVQLSFYNCLKSVLIPKFKGKVHAEVLALVHIADIPKNVEVDIVIAL